MWQIVAIYIIGALVAVYLGYKLYRIFHRREYDKLCSGCPIYKECAKSKNNKEECRSPAPGANRRDAKCK